MIPANHPINSFGPGKPKRSSARKSRSGCMSVSGLSSSSYPQLLTDTQPNPANTHNPNKRYLKLSHCNRNPPA
ncbi:hypothetical protein HZ326_29669 [Fusarium oxysporum f. sp. albedinis]|nr:hypothetical protein HZ326_29669 [Fusarium oxysporum f. sp. albedinis]